MREGREEKDLSLDPVFTDMSIPFLQFSMVTAYSVSFHYFFSLIPFCRFSRITECYPYVATVTQPVLILDGHGVYFAKDQRMPGPDTRLSIPPYRLPFSHLS